MVQLVDPGLLLQEQLAAIKNAIQTCLIPDISTRVFLSILES